MLKEKKAKDIFDEFSEKRTGEGGYGEANFDKGEVNKIKNLAIADYEYGKRLRNDDEPNWRVIFNIHYDSFRELCDALMRFEKQQVSNHQALFAFIIEKFPKLEFDWKFLENIRKLRNQSKYQGIDVVKEKWKSIEFQIDLYISTLKKEIEKRLN